jgi:hypothetical protein
MEAEMKRALPFVAAVAWMSVCVALAVRHAHENQDIVDEAQTTIRTQRARIEELQLRNGELYASAKDWEDTARKIDRDYLTCVATVKAANEDAPTCLPEESASDCQERIGDDGRYEVIEQADGTLTVEVKP